MQVIVENVPGGEEVEMGMKVLISRSSASTSATWPAARKLTGRNGALTVSYAGSKGTHMTLQGGGTSSTINLNALPDQYLALGSHLADQVANPFFGILPTTALGNQNAKATIQRGLLLKPFPQFVNVSQVSPHYGDSNYHALQTSYRQRVKWGGQLSVAYTWSKLIGNTDSIINFLDTNSTTGAVQDPNNLAAERSLSSYDIPHNLVINYGIALPFGRNQHWLSSANGIADKLVSGWRLSGITSFQSGTPLAFTAGDPNNQLSILFGFGTIRPNVVPGCDPRIDGPAQSRLNGWFNKSCFTVPGTFAPGNASRTDARMRTQGTNNWDIAVNKETAITERAQLQFETEFFNAFNRVRFAPPNTSIASPQAGQVIAQANRPRAIQFALRVKF